VSTVSACIGSGLDATAKSGPQRRLAESKIALSPCLKMKIGAHLWDHFIGANKHS
jgi:hypothetical protein